MDDEKDFARHEEYKENCIIWKKCRDAAAGEDKVKACGTEYLPKTSSFLSESDYAMYLRRAEFFGATGRTIEGLTGALIRKDPVVTYPDDDFLKSVGIADDSILDLVQRTARELLTVGRVGYLVDIAPDDGASEILPYVAEYRAEDIINWHKDFILGRLQLVFVVLCEEVTITNFNNYGKRQKIKQYRVLRLGYVSGDVTGLRPSDLEKPIYFQQIWRKKETVENGEKKEEWYLAETIVPRKIGGRLWEEIPFIIANPRDCGCAVDKPPLIDLVNTNFSHYLNSADLEWGRHFTALPTPYAIGITDQKGDLVIGSSRAWVISEADASVGMLEFSGAGLGHLQTGMEAKEKRMAVLGSRLLEAQKTGVEAAEALNIRTNSEGATLQGIGRRVSETWTKLLKWIYAWTSLSEKDDIKLEVNTDFNPTKMPSDQLTALMAAYQSGMISFPVWYWHLQQGEMLPEGMTQEDFEAQLQQGGPSSTDPVKRAQKMQEALAQDDADQDKEESEKKKKEDEK